MSELRIIKKYPNRRLYDTEQSKYITVADLRALITDGIDIEVQDAGNGDDITRSVLLQIINDQENKDEPMFTTEILTRMIRFYGGQSQHMFTDYLGKSLEVFLEQHQTYQNSLTEMFEQSPMHSLTEITRRNMEIWGDMQKKMMEGTGVFSTGTKKNR